ncbi:MAG TPA: hypothetical protein VGS41_05980 [Chthonomonadales bacterium]|nr:hypothetical protein [Chthonomonadales bacterium]
MFPWLDAAGAVEELVGLFGANAAQRAAQQARQQAIDQYASAFDSQYNNLLNNNAAGLAAAAGQANDYLRGLGSDVGAGLANAGIYNSSAAAGALDRAAGLAGQDIAGLAGRDYQAAQQYWNAGQQSLANMRFNQALNDLAASRQAALASGNVLNSSLAGIGGYLANLNPSGQAGGSLPDSAGYLYVSPVPSASYPNLSALLGSNSQSGLGMSGANAYRYAVPILPGTINQAAGLAGSPSALLR